MKLLVKFPTRQRADKFFATLKLYYEKLSKKHDYRFIITMDNDDKTMNNDKIRKQLNSFPNLEYHYGNSKSKIAAVNADINDHNWDVLLLASDDMIPMIDGYDDIIMTEMQKHFPNLDGCLHFNDGRKGEKLNTLSILGVELYKFFGYIYHPSYQSLYADDEFMEVTYGMGKCIYIDQVIISHQWTDYICEGDKSKDALYLRNDKPVRFDKPNFAKRKAAGFPR